MKRQGPAADRPFMRRHQAGLAATAAILLVFVAAVAVWGNRAWPPARVPQEVARSRAEIERGRYLTRAAACAACHQTAGGQAYAGGFGVKTPFGTIYGTNITPDPDHGIGRWSALEFYRALTLGIAPGGRRLYPAMPYISYHGVSRPDADLMYGYLMSLRPSAAANRPPDVPFPLKLRMLLRIWNALFFDTEALPVASLPPPNERVAWERGRYLVNVLGHCGECHTPRGGLGQLQRNAWLQGYAPEHYFAPSLRSRDLRERGWTPEDLQCYMHDGMASQGSAFAEMSSVIQHGSQYLSEPDLRAMAMFLLGNGSAPIPLAATTAQRFMDGKSSYVNACAGCHGLHGEGRPHTTPALRTNSTVRAADARNLILSILQGLPEQRFSRVQLSGMPGFAARLNDSEVAALVNYVRTEWGAQPGDVGSAAVARLRAGKH